MLDAGGQRGLFLVYKQSPSRIARHQQLNDLVIRALVSRASVFTTKEPVGFICRDDKQPDGMTCRSGKLLVWDVTAVTVTD